MSAVSNSVQRPPVPAHALALTTPAGPSPAHADEPAPGTELSIDPPPPREEEPQLEIRAVTFHFAATGPAAALADMLAPAEVIALATTSREGRDVWVGQVARRMIDELLRGWQGLYEEQVAGLHAGSHELGDTLNRIGEFEQAEILIRTTPSPDGVERHIPQLIHSRLHAGNAQGALALAAALNRPTPTDHADLVKAAIVEGLAFEARLALHHTLNFRRPLEAMVKHLQGRTDEAQADLDRMASRVMCGLQWVEFAQAYGQMGHWQGALRSLARAIRSHQPGAVGVPFSALWRPIRANEHVARVVGRAHQLAASKFVRRQVAAAMGNTPPANAG